MLKKEQFVYYGKFLKPHGTKGEITLESDGFTLGDDCNFVACDIDGILVPFFFESVRPKNHDSIIVKIERMDSAESVRYLTNRDAYIPRQWVDESEELTWSYFIGFKATDNILGNIGNIIDIDESTINTLFVVEGKNNEILIPAIEDFIESIDHENKEIIFDLPQGLISL